MQDALKTNNIIFLADKGYYSRIDIKNVLDTGAEMLVPKSDTTNFEKAGIFSKALFKYNKQTDEYTCPTGNILPYRRSIIDKGLKLRVYVDHVACRDCSIRSQCTRSEKEPRKMKRWEHEDTIDDMLARLKATKNATIIRKQTVEHPFGTIKMWMGATHYLTKRLKNVSTETSLHALAYKLKRMMKIKGTIGLREAMKQ